MVLVEVWKGLCGILCFNEPPLRQDTPILLRTSFRNRGRRGPVVPSRGWWWRGPPGVLPVPPSSLRLRQTVTQTGSLGQDWLVFASGTDRLHWVFGFGEIGGPVKGGVVEGSTNVEVEDSRDGEDRNLRRVKSRKGESESLRT